MLTVLVFREDLRLTDNPALAAAVARGPVVPLFVLDEPDAGRRSTGGASRWWLHGSLAALDGTLRARGSRLVLRRGATDTVIAQLLSETGADAVYWNRRYEPWATAQDERLKTALTGRGIEVRSFNATLLCEPWTLSNHQGEPYRVFTPFWRALRIRVVPAAPVRPPERIPAPAVFPLGDDLASWALRPTTPDWAGGLAATWTPGEAGAHARLDAFADQAMLNYGATRNLPGVEGTSRLSPHLHFGEIGPHQVWRAVTAHARAKTGRSVPDGVETYLSQIAWREFSSHLLFHVPTLPEAPLRPAFADFPWSEDAPGLAAWQRGRTGYPIVDAGMRELWATGWMHNRVRMIVASFLVKDLLVHWRTGESWFWDTLVDADLANNVASWQWVAGCGADAAPFFRVFNPALQGAKFDPHGHYVRRWMPELARLPNAVLHTPWDAPPIALADAGVRLGREYPMRIVDHATARQRALEAWQQIRR